MPTNRAEDYVYFTDSTSYTISQARPASGFAPIQWIEPEEEEQIDYSPGRLMLANGREITPDEYGYSAERRRLKAYGPPQIKE